MMQLAKAGAETYDTFYKQLGPKMTRALAYRVRELRSRHSYRIIAITMHMEMGGDWFPIYNQLAGMVLCRLAAEFLKQDPNLPPWEPLKQ